MINKEIISMAMRFPLARKIRNIAVVVIGLLLLSVGTNIYFIIKLLVG